MNDTHRRWVKQQADFERAVAALSDRVPNVVWNYYNGLRKQGFDEDRAMMFALALQSTIVTELLRRKEHDDRRGDSW